MMAAVVQTEIVTFANLHTVAQALLMFVSRAPSAPGIRAPQDQSGGFGHARS